VGDLIRFYRVSAEYGSFSNFSPHPIRLKGKVWPTSEHYFQAQKFAGTPDEEVVRQAKSPMIAARMGRSRKRPLRNDWESAKDAIMHEAVLAKFTQHADLRDLLLGTGDAEIVEHTQNDAYWGDGGDGSGKNRLGQILMRVREELRQPDDCFAVRTCAMPWRLCHRGRAAAVDHFGHDTRADRLATRADREPAPRSRGCAPRS
jgi:N-glycosidase YbiA